MDSIKIRFHIRSILAACSILVTDVNQVRDSIYVCSTDSFSFLLTLKGCQEGKTGQGYPRTF